MVGGSNSFGSLHLRPTGRACGEPDEIKTTTSTPTRCKFYHSSSSHVLVLEAPALPALVWRAPVFNAVEPVEGRPALAARALPVGAFAARDVATRHAHAGLFPDAVGERLAHDVPVHCLGPRRCRCRCRCCRGGRGGGYAAVAVVRACDARPRHTSSRLVQLQFVWASQTAQN